jgi:hypothetical protein
MQSFFPSPSLFPLRASTFGTDLYIDIDIPIRSYKIEIQITTGDESDQEQLQNAYKL